MKTKNIVNSSSCSYHVLFLWSRNVHRQQPERSEIFIFSGLSLSSLSLVKVKITADILMAFAGEFFTEEIKDT